LKSFETIVWSVANMPEMLFVSDINTLVWLQIDGGEQSVGCVSTLTTQGRYKELYSFSGDDGYGPRFLALKPRTHQLYGLWFNGGQFGSGPLFRVDLDTDSVDILYSLILGRDTSLARSIAVDDTAVYMVFSEPSSESVPGVL